MTKLLIAVFALILSLLSPLALHAQRPPTARFIPPTATTPKATPKATPEAESALSAEETDFRETFGRATVAVFLGKQECSWAKQNFLFWTVWKWNCGFKSHFTCTGTVIDNMQAPHYMVLTAGHCINPDMLDNYYIADTAGEKPVMHHVEIIKYENDDRYDYAIFAFKSMHDYPMIEIAGGDIPPVGTRVINVNFSYGVTKEFLEGKVVSGLIRPDESNEYKECRGRYLATIGVGPGASGSAVVDAETHKIVGLAEGIFPSTQMPTLVIPTGNTLMNFIDDDSAGLAALPPGPKPKDDDDAPPPTVPTPADTWPIYAEVAGFGIVMSIVTVLGVRRGLRRKKLDKSKKPL